MIRKTINHRGVVCHFIFISKISGERLQDHWSSCYSVGAGLFCLFNWCLSITYYDFQRYFLLTRDFQLPCCICFSFIHCVYDLSVHRDDSLAR